VVIFTEQSVEKHVFRLVGAQQPNHVGIPFKLVMIDEAHQQTSKETALSRQVLGRLS
jgi:predicted transcriptional regulator